MGTRSRARITTPEALTSQTKRYKRRGLREQVTLCELHLRKGTLGIMRQEGRVMGQEQRETIGSYNYKT